MDIFAKGLKKKVRFETSKGLLTIEQLMDLPLTSKTGKVHLNEIAQGLHAETKSADTTDFVGAGSTLDPVVKLKFDIVIEVIKITKEANEASQKKIANGIKRAKIQEEIDKKTDNIYTDVPLDELQKMQDELED